tara:strand:- start:14321 stop:21319 length:6999 start_codon:yes stop_codon:yes gene_type:complete
MEELDEFGIPIKKSQEVVLDEFGIPVKKKEPTSEDSTEVAEPISEEQSIEPQKESLPQQPSEFSTTKKETDYFEGAFGASLKAIDAVTIWGLGEFVDDMARSVNQGINQGAAVDNGIEVMLQGSKASDETIDKLIAANEKMSELGASDEMTKFQETYETEGKDVYAFFKALYESPQAIPEIMVSSFAAMANPASLGAAGTVVGGSAAGGALLGGVGAAPAALASIPFAVGAAGATLETGLTFTELLVESLDGKEFNKENIRTTLEDSEKLNSIRSKAAARGAVIGVIDAFTGKLAGRVGAKLLKGSRASKLASGSASTAIESVGGAGGEAAARAVIGQEMDVAEIMLEGIAEAPMGVFNTAVETSKRNISSYSINGERMSRNDFQSMIINSSPEDIAKMKINIDNDQIMSDKVVRVIQSDKVKKEIQKVNGNISEANLDAVVELELELNSLEGNKTQAAKNRVSEIKTVINEKLGESPQETPAKEKTGETTEELELGALKDSNPKKSQIYLDRKKKVTAKFDKLIAKAKSKYGSNPNSTAVSDLQEKKQEALDILTNKEEAENSKPTSEKKDTAEDLDFDVLDSDLDELDFVIDEMDKSEQEPTLVSKNIIEDGGEQYEIVSITRKKYGSHVVKAKQILTPDQRAKRGKGKYGTTKRYAGQVAETLAKDSKLGEYKERPKPIKYKTKGKSKPPSPSSKPTFSSKEKPTIVVKSEEDIDAELDAEIKKIEKDLVDFEESMVDEVAAMDENKGMVKFNGNTYQVTKKADGTYAISKRRDDGKLIGIKKNTPERERVVDEFIKGKEKEAKKNMSDAEELVEEFKKESEDKIMAALDKAIEDLNLSKLRGQMNDVTTVLGKAVANGILRAVRASYKAGLSLRDAIEYHYNTIKDSGVSKKEFYKFIKYSLESYSSKTPSISKSEKSGVPQLIVESKAEPQLESGEIDFDSISDEEGSSMSDKSYRIDKKSNFGIESDGGVNKYILKSALGLFGGIVMPVTNRALILKSISRLTVLNKILKNRELSETIEYLKSKYSTLYIVEDGVASLKDDTNSAINELANLKFEEYSDLEEQTRKVFAAARKAIETARDNWKKDGNATRLISKIEVSLKKEVNKVAELIYEKYSKVKNISELQTSEPKTKLLSETKQQSGVQKPQKKQPPVKSATAEKEVSTPPKKLDEKTKREEAKKVLADLKVKLKKLNNPLGDDNIQAQGLSGDAIIDTLFDAVGKLVDVGFDISQAIEAVIKSSKAMLKGFDEKVIRKKLKVKYKEKKKKDKPPKKSFTTKQLIAFAEKDARMGGRAISNIVKDFAKIIAKAIKELPNNLSSTQVKQIIRAAAGVRLQSQMNKFEATVEKIINKAGYSEKLATTQKKTKQAIKNFKKKASQIKNGGMAILSTDFPANLQPLVDRFLDSVSKRESVINPDMEAYNELMEYINSEVMANEDVEESMSDEEVELLKKESEEKKKKRAEEKEQKVDEAVRAIDGVKSMEDIEEDGDFNEKFERDLVRTLKELPKAFLETLPIATISNLIKEAVNVSNGFLSDGFLSQIESKYNGWVSSQEVVSSDSALTSDKSSVELLKGIKAVEGSKVSVNEKTLFHHISALFKSKGNITIYDTIAHKLTSAFNTVDRSGTLFAKKLNSLTSKAVGSRSGIAGKVWSFIRGTKIDSRYRLNVLLDLILFENQHLKNKNNDKLPPVSQMVAAVNRDAPKTDENPNNNGANKLNISEDERKIINDLYESLPKTKDGFLDTKKIESNMTPEEKALLKFIRDHYKDSEARFKEMAFSRGESYEKTIGYSKRRSVASDNKAPESFIDRAKSMYKKAGSTQAKISEDPLVRFGAISAIAEYEREMSEDFHTMKAILDFNATIRSMKKDGRYNQEVVEALDFFIKAHVMAHQASNPTRKSLSERAANAIVSNVGNALLIGVKRLFYDLPANTVVIANEIGNLSKAIKDKELLKAVKAMDVGRIMKDSGASHEGRRGSSTVDIASPNAGFGKFDASKRSVSEAIVETLESNKAKALGQAAGEGYYKLIDFMIPFVWKLKFAVEFKKITGENLDPSKLDNEAYMHKHRRAYAKAGARADKHVSDSYNTASTFEKGLRQKTSNVFDRSVKYFMLSFGFNEHQVLWDAMRSTVGKGSMTKSEGAIKAATAVTRMAVYQSLSTLIASVIKNGLPDDEDELDELLTRMTKITATDLLTILVLGNKNALVQGLAKLTGNSAQEVYETWNDETLFDSKESIFYGGGFSSYNDAYKQFGSLGVAMGSAFMLGEFLVKLGIASFSDEDGSVTELLKEAKTHLALGNAASLTLGLPAVDLKAIMQHTNSEKDDNKYSLPKAN